MKKDTIVVHCSASDNKKHDNIATMRRWHLARNFKDVGYMYFIRKDGTVEEGRAENVQAAGAIKWNRRGIHICLHGLKKEKFTPAQFEAAAKLIISIRKRHEIVAIIPHNLVANKTCPVFNIVDELYPRLYEARFKR